MTSESVRVTILESLNDSALTPPLQATVEQAFLRGDTDIRLDALALDSLARMELLIALELTHGVVITPAEFARLHSLEDLTRAVCAARLSPVAPAVVRPSEHPDAPHAMPAGQSAVPPVVALLRRALRHGTTAGHMNTVLDTFEHRLAPTEVQQLIQCHAGGQLHAGATPAQETALSQWIGGMADQLALSAAAPVQAFTRHRLNPSTVLFRGTGHSADKTLLLGFTARGKKLMVPHATLLQRIDASRFDVLIVSDPWSTSFRGRVPQMGHGAEEVVEALASMALLRDYGTHRVFGCSAGCYPALLAAIRLRADACICIAGRFPSERHWAEIVRMYRTVRRASRHAGNTRFLYTFDGAKKRDRAFAKWMGGPCPGTRLGVQIEGHTIGHMLLRALQDHGALASFVACTLVAPLGHGYLAGQPRTESLRFPAVRTAAVPV